MRKLVLPLVCGLFAFSACVAGDKVSSPLKVDLAEVVASGSVSPVDGITAAGQPDEAALRVFAENGYVAVVDLRTEGEDRKMNEPEAVEELGMAYVSMPISGDGITFDNARQLKEVLDGYDEPVLLHCASANRVGAMLALIASLEGDDDDTALAKGREGGMTRLEGKVREVLKSH